MAGRTSDRSHLTIKVNPGKRAAHIYVAPVDRSSATDDTIPLVVRWAV